METKIPHQKIAIRTLISVLIMAVVIFLLNSWPNIKSSLNGDSPTFNEWVAYISKFSTIILLLFWGIFFYYTDWAHQRELIKDEKK